MKRTYFLLQLMILGMLFTSCKEQHMLEMEHYIKQLFLIGSGEEGKLLLRKVDFAESSSEVATTVCVSGSLAPDQDVHVTLEEDASGIASYNQKHKSEKDIKYQLLPAENYEISSMDIVVKAGEIDALVPIKVMPEGLHCDSLYAIPLKIKSCAEYPIVNPDDVVLIAISTYNQYAGSYNYVGEKDNIAFSFLRQAVAVDANTIRIYNTGNENLDLVANEGLKIHLNEDNTLTLEGWDKMAVTEGSGTYDPQTKTFSLDFKYKDAGGAEHTVVGTLVSATGTTEE